MTLFRFALIVSACVPIVAAADFFPLQEGNTWNYRDAKTGQTLTVAVGKPVNILGNVYYQLTGYTDSDLLVRIEPAFGALVYWNEARQQENILTSFEPFEGGYWFAPFRTCPEEEGQTQTQRGTHDGPAGPVSDVLEIRYRAVGCADVGPVGEQFAEHLGMLRRTQTSFAGPLTFDLVSARVGNVTIDTAPSARFTLSVSPFTPGKQMTATFRLAVNSSAPLVLSFPSSQEYDFSMKDSLGNVVWSWSPDRIFLQLFHQRTITGEWSASVQIPSLPGLQPGDYRLEATITGTPVFKAAVPFNVPAAVQ